MKKEKDNKRKEFISLLGDLGDRHAVQDCKVLEEQNLDKYIQKLIEYKTLEKEKIQAYLLIPKNIDKPAPGIIAIHQDGEHRPYEFGKSEPAGIAGDPELKYSLELCERGYVVICPNRFPFEERSLSNSKYKALFAALPIFGEYNGEKIELTEDLYRGSIANRLIFEGKTLLGKELYEHQCALDILCELPEVDKERIGAIGHSAGGMLTALLMYIDLRVKAGCSSCGTALFKWFLGKDKLKPMAGFGTLFAIPGLEKWGDIDDVLTGLAPRPFMETAGDRDENYMNSVHKKALEKYKELGIEDRYKTILYDAKAHMFRKDMRELSYNWFDKWLKG